jgi:hypothetical protein
MTEVATTTDPQKAGHPKLAELVRRLSPPTWQCRCYADGEIILLAGTRGIVRPGPGGALVVILRKPAPDLVKQMLDSGLIEVTSTGDLLLARMPEPREFSLVREALGLHRQGTV